MKNLEEPRIKYISHKAKGVYANILLDDWFKRTFEELPNCGRALSPDATVLDNFCFSMHNMQFLEERPSDLRQEIFELLFDAANIATFAPEDRIKCEYAMTTERDIRNQIRYAEKQGLAQGMEQGMKQGMKQGKEQGVLEVARRMLDAKMPIEQIVEFTGLGEEQVRTLMPPQASA